MHNIFDWGLSDATFAVLCGVAALVLAALLGHECWYQLRRFRARVHRRFWQSQLPKGLRVQGLEPMAYARDVWTPRMALHLSVCQACDNRQRCRSASQAGLRCELPYCPLRGTARQFVRRQRRAVTAVMHTAAALRADA
jgi:hypothetical protein